MLTAVPKSWFSWDFWLQDPAGKMVAEVRLSSWRERGSVVVAGTTYKIFRKSLLGPFVMEAPDGSVLRKSALCQAEARRRADEALERTGMDRLRDVPAEDLNLLQEKRLEIARALATNPEVLLLDEVMAGLRPAEAREAVTLVKQLNAEGVTVVFIEHVMPVVRDLAHRVLVMDYGRELAMGTYAEVTADERVVRAYLGEAETEAT